MMCGDSDSTLSKEGLIVGAEWGGKGSGSSNVNRVTSRPHGWPSFSWKLSSEYALNELINFP